MKIKNSSAITLAALAALFCGCFEYEEELSLQANGTGTLRVFYRTHEDTEVNGDGYTLPKERDDIKREIEEKYTSDKVTLREFRVEESGGWQEVDFTVSFDKAVDLNSIRHFTNNKIEITEKSRGRYRFFRTMEIDSNWDEDEEASFLEKMAVAFLENAVLDKVKFRFTVNSQGEIEGHNADWLRDKKTAVWRFTLTDLVKKSKIDMYFESR